MASDNKDSGVKVFKSKVFTTEEVTAVFPHLNEVDRFGGYSIDVDVLENTAFRKTVEGNAKDTLEAAQKSLGTKKMPTNAIVKDGVYEDAPWSRMSFKMKAIRTVRGEEIKQSPRLVDANRNSMNDEIWGGSRVKIAYFVQYTLMPTGTFLSLKLNAVQVLTLVGPNGEVSVEELFDTEEGFVSATDVVPVDPEPLPADPGSTQPLQSGSDF